MVFSRCWSIAYQSLALQEFPRSRLAPQYGYGSIPIDTFLVGWTSIYQLFWGSLGTRVLTHPHMVSSRLPCPPRSSMLLPNYPYWLAEKPSDIYCSLHLSMVFPFWTMAYPISVGAFWNLNQQFQCQAIFGVTTVEHVQSNRHLMSAN